MRSPDRFLLYAVVSAAVWCAFVPLYRLLFSWAEFIPGINWVYLPHGLRMILVLMFGIAGALGFTLGAALLRFMTVAGAEVGLSLDLSLAIIPGIAAWLAVALVLGDWPGKRLQPMAASAMVSLSGRSLLLVAFVSAMLNSAAHATAWWMYDEGGVTPFDRYLSMFVGDLLGAVLLLYILKTLTPLLDMTASMQAGETPEDAHEKTEKRADRSVSPLSLVARRTE